VRKICGLNTALLLLALCVPGCEKKRTQAGSAVEDTMLREQTGLAGVLVTYQRGTEIGRETYQMDSDGLRSTIQFGGNQLELNIPRTIGTIKGEQLGQTFERELDADTVALENGSWQAYAIAAERFEDALLPRSIKVMLPASNHTMAGTIQVTPAGKERLITLNLGGLEVKVRVFEDGRVLSALVEAQGLQVLPEGQLPDALTPDVPENVDFHPFVHKRPDAVLKGDLWIPKAQRRSPLVVIVAGSGPTDRDGNNMTGLQTNVYRMISEGLADHGVSTLRYDKRGVGTSTSTLSEDSLTIQTFSNDLVSILRQFEGDERFSGIYIAGHSEGGLLAILAAQSVPVSGLVLLATAGRNLEDILLEQLEARATEFMPEVRRILEAMKQGRDVEDVPDGLQGLFRPSVQPFLKSQLTLDPSELLGALSIPVLIVQGTHDVQVKEADAQRLHKARPDGRLLMLTGSSHVLKDDGPEFPQRSYNDPNLALSSGLMPALVEFLGLPRVEAEVVSE